MPDIELLRVLERVRSRWRLRAVLQAIVAGGAVFAASLIVLTISDAVGAHRLVPLALAPAALVTLWLVVRAWTLSLTEAARRVEAATPLDNLIVTAAMLEEQPRPVRAEIRDAITRLAHEKLTRVDPARAVPLVQPIAAAAAVLIGCGLLVANAPDASMSRPAIAARQDERDRGEAGTITVHVSPPAYTRRPAEVLENPLQVTAIAGSEIRVTAGSRVLREWRATQSESLELRAAGDAPPRFLSIVVVRDAPPLVRIHTPGRDLAFAEPKGTVAIGVDGRDDLGMTSLTLRYTKASGGGETVTFAEGEVPLDIERTNDREWTARARWPLDALDLSDGDVLVYRAIARDGNPAGEPAQSDAYLVEIGRTAEIASAGFALPSEERKYAISQQMVIYKTEQLIKAREQHAGDWVDQTRMIAIEQRMVRAEVVFLGGGEVEDEVEEATQSHELAEGRLENQGRAEMLRAINFMSRAEAQLNDGRAEDALAFERQALASLERALDRRRYFLRTLPDRSRIDASRRLSGERREARSWERERAEPPIAPGLDRSRTVMRELAASLSGDVIAGPALAARVAAIDPDSAALQKAAVAIAAASTAEERRDAVREAMRAVTADALGRLPAAQPIRLNADPLAGRLTDALTAPASRSPR